MSKKYVFLFLLIGLLVVISCAGVARSAFALTEDPIMISANLKSGKTQSERTWYLESTSTYFADQFVTGAYYDANGINSNNCTSVRGSGNTNFDIYVRATITVKGVLIHDVDSGKNRLSISATAARPAWEPRPTQATNESKVQKSSDKSILKDLYWQFNQN